jgi:uncharacterized membrane protein SirB2
MNLLLHFLVYVLYVLVGGVCIRYAVKRFIEGKYFLFGTALICSIYLIVNVIDHALMI